MPLLDLINCQDLTPSRVHRTDYDGALRAAVTRAPRAWAEGEQVFEDYGQPNHVCVAPRPEAPRALSAPRSAIRDPRSAIRLALAASPSPRGDAALARALARRARVNASLAYDPSLAARRYFLYHGFALEANAYDCVRVDLAIEQGDAGARDVGALRRRLREAGFHVASHSGCARPTAARGAAINPAQNGGDDAGPAPFELLAFLAIKLDLEPPPRGAPASPALLRAWADLVGEKARAHAAHEAAGGADGAPPSARVLLAKERAMLDALHEELEQQCASGLEAAA